MNNIKRYTDYVNEIKSERKVVQDLARHLSFDKEVIKYLNTSRAKRTEGWRELLSRKLHGDNLNYINYITKNMVADYNPQITGFIGLGNEEDEEEKDGENIASTTNKLSLGEIVDNINDRVENVEDVLGVKPKNMETVHKAIGKLKEIGYEPDWLDDDEKETKDDEEEE